MHYDVHVGCGIEQAAAVNKMTMHFAIYCLIQWNGLWYFGVCMCERTHTILQMQ